MPTCILAIEASGMGGEVALLEEGKVVLEQPLAAEQRTAQSLAPGIRAALDLAGWRPNDVQLVAVTIGPGSFTGLRVGVMTAKTFAYATGCAVLGVDTLAVIAAQASVSPEKQLWSVLDAQRGQLFAEKFAVVEGRWQSAAPAQIVDADAWLNALSANEFAIGSGLKRLQTQLPPNCAVASDLWQPRAATVGELAWREYQSCRRDDLWKLAPVYLRASAAEEKAAGS
jgi:tRNA threonylcarbamoyladenosine biosynthesis protein TsaB